MHLEWGDAVELPPESDGGAIERNEITVSFLSRLVDEPRHDVDGGRRGARRAAVVGRSYTPGMSGAAIDRTAEWQALKERYLRPAGERPATTARGVHHTAHISSDVARTIDFYQGLLGFPLTELFENRDYPGSTHFFFDIGGGNALAFFDFPGLDVGPYAEVLGGHHHLAISVEPEQWQVLRGRLDEAGIEYLDVDGVSMYFRGPDGERIELLSDPLGEMYGEKIL